MLLAQVHAAEERGGALGRHEEAGGVIGRGSPAGWADGRGEREEEGGHGRQHVTPVLTVSKRNSQFLFRRLYTPNSAMLQVLWGESAGGTEATKLLNKTL